MSDAKHVSTCSVHNMSCRVTICCMLFSIHAETNTVTICRKAALAAAFISHLMSKIWLLVYTCGSPIYLYLALSPRSGCWCTLAGPPSVHLAESWAPTFMKAVKLEKSTSTVHLIGSPVFLTF